MTKYADIERVNQAIKTTDIKGKEYAEVNQRIKAFRMLYPEGYIKTDIISLDAGVCVIKATVGFYTYDEHGIIENTIGTGYAYEKEGSTFINKTSYIENCETSAVGRALGMAGLGIDTSVASSEEVQNAMLNQGEEEPKGKMASPKQVETIMNILKKKDPNGEFDEEKVKKLTMKEASDWISANKEGKK